MEVVVFCFALFFCFGGLKMYYLLLLLLILCPVREGGSLWLQDSREIQDSQV